MYNDRRPRLLCFNRSCFKVDLRHSILCTHLFAKELRRVPLVFNGRQSREKLASNASRDHRLTKLRPIRTVPADNRVEALQLFPHFRIERTIAHTHKIDAGRRKRSDARGESNQRRNCTRHPNLRIFGNEMFKSWECQNAIANRART